MVVVDGLTEIEAPVPTSVPPQLPEYHFHEAAVPSEPPFILNEELLPLHIGDVPDMEVAAVDSVPLEATTKLPELEVQPKNVAAKL